MSSKVKQSSFLLNVLMIVLGALFILIAIVKFLIWGEILPSPEWYDGISNRIA